MKADLVIQNIEAIVPHSSIATLDRATRNLGIGLKRQKVHISIQNGRIIDIQDASQPPHDSHQTIAGKGLTALPGLIDTQVHFREPGLTHKETIETGSLAAAFGGITSYFEMPNTSPSTTTKERLQEKMNIAAKSSWVNYAFYAGGAVDNVEQIASLEQFPGSPGIKIFLGASTGNLLVDSDQVLEEIIQKTERRLVVHSEDEARLKERKHIAIDGKNASYHPIWRDAESAMISTKKLVTLAHKYKKQVHVLHISTKDEIEYLAHHLDVATTEVLPQHLYFSAPECYERLGNLIQQNPPIRSDEHRQGLIKALQKGLFDIFASDHAPHTLEEKAKEYPNSPSGVPGTQTLFFMGMHFVQNGIMSLEQLVQLMTYNPRQIFGMNSKGVIQVGADADLTIVDLKAETRIENKIMKSKSSWTPYEGLKVPVQIVHLIVGGKFVLKEKLLQTEKAGQAISFSTKGINS